MLENQSQSCAHLNLKCVVQVLTIRHGVYPVLVEAGRDGVQLCRSSRLLQLSPLFRESALHHGCLGEGAIWILMDRMKTVDDGMMMIEKCILSNCISIYSTNIQIQM